MRKKSHELQWLEVMSQRNGLDEDEIKNYQRLKRGYQGEVSFDKMCHLFLESEVEMLDNLTLKYQFDTVQIDKLLMVGNTLYLVDVKYYRGSYVFEGGEWRMGTTTLSNNIYEQLRRAKRVVQNIFREADMKINVQGVLVFINPESSIKILDDVSEKTLAFNEISAWLMKLGGKNSQALQWKNLLRAFEIKSYRTSRMCSMDKFEKLKKGVRCLKCGGFDMVEDWYIFHCSCGNSEVRETAYVRTICEYGVIMHKNDLKPSDLKILFGNCHYRYLKRMLLTHFKLKASSGSSSTYINSGELFEYVFKDKIDYFNKTESRKNWKKRV